MHNYYVAEEELLVHNGEGVCPKGKVKIESAGEIVRNAINDLIRDLKETTNGKGVVRNFESSGDMNKLLKILKNLI